MDVPKTTKWYYPAKGGSLSSSWQPTDSDHHEKLSRNNSRAAELFRTLRRRNTGPIWWHYSSDLFRREIPTQHSKNSLQSPSSVLENSGPQGKIWGLIIMAAHLLEASTRNIIFIVNHKNKIRCSWNIPQSTRKLEDHKMSPLDVRWTPNVESRPLLTDELIEFEN